MIADTSHAKTDPEPQAVRSLLVVYNADSGFIGEATYVARKLLRIGDCALCSITHRINEKDEWKDCKASLGVEVKQLHRNELTAGLEKVVDGQLPCILAETDEGFQMLLTPAVLERCRGSVEDLRGKILFHSGRLGLSIETA